MKFRIQIDNRKTNSIFILSLAYSWESIGIRLTFSSLLSIFNIKFSIKDPQTYDIINFTVRLSEGCHFDYQSRITISYVNNCSAICLKTIRSRGRTELYTILWKNKREWCLRPNLTRLGFQWHCVKKWLQSLFLHLQFRKFDLTFCFPLLLYLKIIS